MHVSEYDNNAIYTLLIALIALNCKLLDMYAQIKQTNKQTGLQLDDIVLILLLFADDIAIVSKSPEEIQNH